MRFVLSFLTLAACPEPAAAPESAPVEASAL